VRKIFNFGFTLADLVDVPQFELIGAPVRIIVKSAAASNRLSRPARIGSV
jgi:hypothetical protein